MKIIKTDFPGLVELEPKVFGDERGFFLETYSHKVFMDMGIDVNFVQDNHAYSKDKYVLRGLHYQNPPTAQAKLVWVVSGEVLDVVVDIRKGSPTFGKHYRTILSAENKKRLFVPAGFAHGYVTLKEDTEFMYKVDAYYSPDDDRGILWADPALGIDWQLPEGQVPVLSAKDECQPLFEEVDSPFKL